jgi:MerR family transcriptional regulator, heat shock protein HspR
MSGSSTTPGPKGSEGRASTNPAGEQGVYAISIAAELTGIEPHTLRSWENAGLLTTHRSDGGTRRYSPDDLTLARHIGDLADAGLNLPGIAHVLDLERQLLTARREIERLGRQLQQRTKA